MTKTHVSGIADAFIMAATPHYIFPFASLTTVASFSSPTKSNLIPSSHLPSLASTPPSSHSNTDVSTTSTVVLRGAKLALTSAVVAATVFPLCASAAEPSNALSLPTWAIHVSSVAEWVTAMALVWEYGEKSEYESWKGLSWGMVPLFGGALCACTWHFFYNSESLEMLVALQAALTVFGNFTMCFAAYRIYKSCQGGPGKP